MLPRRAPATGNRTYKKLHVATRLVPPAEIQDDHAHQFRDTFAVELLLAGVPLERVSILLRHSSMKIMEEHYSPWVLARQEQLERDVRSSWQSAIEGTREVHEKSGLVN